MEKKKEAMDEKVCYVCGSLRHTDQYLLNVKPVSLISEPHFPFLETHEPPAKYIGSPSDKQVSSGCRCREEEEEGRAALPIATSPGCGGTWSPGGHVHTCINLNESLRAFVSSHLRELEFVFAARI